jgi:hypothetical protein
MLDSDAQANLDAYLGSYEPGAVHAEDIVRGELFGIHSAQRPTLEDPRTVSAFADALAGSINRTIASGQEVDGDVTYEGVRRVLCGLLQSNVESNVELNGGEVLGVVMGYTSQGMRVSPVNGGKTVEVVDCDRLPVTTKVVVTLADVKRAGDKRMALANLVRSL